MFNRQCVFKHCTDNVINYLYIILEYHMFKKQNCCQAIHSKLCRLAPDPTLRKVNDFVFTAYKWKWKTYEP